MVGDPPSTLTPFRGVTVGGGCGWCVSWGSPLVPLCTIKERSSEVRPGFSSAGLNVKFPKITESAFFSPLEHFVNLSLDPDCCLSERAWVYFYFVSSGSQSRPVSTANPNPLKNLSLIFFPHPKFKTICFMVRFWLF